MSPHCQHRTAFRESQVGMESACSIQFCNELPIDKEKRGLGLHLNQGSRILLELVGT